MQEYMHKFLKRWFTLGLNRTLRDIYQNWACISLPAFLDIGVLFSYFTASWNGDIRRQGITGARVSHNPREMDTVRRIFHNK